MERAKGQPVLLLDAGNGLYGSQPLTRDTQGRVAVEAMNRLGYQAATLGDMDLAWGLDVFRQRLSEARFPLVSANIALSETGKLLLSPYTLVEVGGRTVGVLGLARRDRALLLPKGQSGGLVVLDPLAAARQYLPELAQRSDIVIVLSQLGLGENRQLAKEVPGIDVIVSGGSRMILDPLVVVPETGTVIVEAGYGGEWVGRVTVRFDAAGKVIGQNGQVMPLTAQFEDDPEMAAFLAGR